MSISGVRYSGIRTVNISGRCIIKISRVFRNLAYFEHDRSQLELNFLVRQKHIENLKYHVTVKLKVIQDKMIEIVKIDFLNLSDFLNQDNYVTWV